MWGGEEFLCVVMDSASGSLQASLFLPDTSGRIYLCHLRAAFLFTLGDYLIVDLGSACSSSISKVNRLALAVSTLAK